MFFLLSLLFTQILLLPTITEAAQGAARRPRSSFIDILLQPKYITMLIIGFVVLFLLRTKKMKSNIKIPLLLLSTFLFGLAGNISMKPFSYFAMHPSPICAATKPLLFGFRIAFIVMLFVIFLLTLIGPKLFCGWVCPVGAIQELIAMLSDKLKIKRIKINFTFSNTIRTGILILFIFISATSILHITYGGKIVPKSLYDYLNTFHGLEFEIQKTFIDNIIHYFPFILTVILAFKFYRPFCYLVCPVGLYTHWLEQISLFKVSLKKSSCNDCQICVEKSPCPTVSDILKDSTLRPDCFSCYVCIESCPKDAFEIRTKKTISSK